MRMFRMTLVASAVVFTASLLLARVHPFGDAGLYASRNAQRRLMLGSSIPPDVRGILVTKCADCHSSQLRLPLYDQVAGRFAPASWLMERDIVEGRKHLNLFLWDTYPAVEQQRLEGMIVEKVKRRDMPPLQYRMVHLNARITEADIIALTLWTRATPLFDDGSSEWAAATDGATGGAHVFEKRCTGCHSLEQNREGPKLGGVFGRPSGDVAGYDYSAALKKASIVWNEASLDKWLADPDAFIPGNNMDFELVNPQERRDLILFLKNGGSKTK